MAKLASPQDVNIIADPNPAKTAQIVFFTTLCDRPTQIR
jgi:hypothetical protein